MGFFGDFLSKFFSKKEENTYINLPVEEEPQEEDENFELDQTMHIDVSSFKPRYIVKINGEYSVFNSKEEMPEEFRQGVEIVEHSDAANSSYTVLVQGERKTYSSYEDVPEDIRAAIESSRP
jgi:hypothetical protein